MYIFGRHPTSTVSSLRPTKSRASLTQGQHYPGKAVWIFCETGAAVPWVAFFSGLWDVEEFRESEANLLRNLTIL